MEIAAGGAAQIMRKLAWRKSSRGENALNKAAAQQQGGRWQPVFERSIIVGRRRRPMSSGNARVAYGSEACRHDHDVRPARVRAYKNVR